MDALIVGQAPTSMWALPYLLSRGGFQVDAITTSTLLRASRFVRRLSVTETWEALPRRAFEQVTECEQPRDLVIARDDETIRALSEMGVFSCACDDDMTRLTPVLSAEPMLMQPRIVGKELDLLAVYLGRDVVHFTYSAIERYMAPNGLSDVRRYFPVSMVDSVVSVELQRLGRALKASGFVSVTCTTPPTDRGGITSRRICARTSGWMSRGTTERMPGCLSASGLQPAQRCAQKPVRIRSGLIRL